MRKPKFITSEPRFGIQHRRDDPRIKRSSLVTGTIRFIEKPKIDVIKNPLEPPAGLSTYYEYQNGLDYYDVEGGETYFDFE